MRAPFLAHLTGSYEVLPSLGVRLLSVVRPLTFSYNTFTRPITGLESILIFVPIGRIHIQPIQDSTFLDFSWHVTTKTELLALIYSLQGINNKANTGSSHYYIFINLILIQTLENGIKQTNAFVLAMFIFMCKHIHHILQISHLWFFSPFICSSNLVTFISNLDIFPLMCALLESGSLNWPWSTKILRLFVTSMHKNLLWCWKFSLLLL
jgi:hypothetical protein